jgi:hypothetical protein
MSRILRGLCYRSGAVQSFCCRTDVVKIQKYVPDSLRFQFNCQISIFLIRYLSNKPAACFLLTYKDDVSGIDVSFEIESLKYYVAPSCTRWEKDIQFRL